MLITPTHPRILMIGAGAIGQVYGHHLANAGAEVSVLVRPHYKEDARAGFSLRQHRIAGMSPKTHRFVPHQVFTSFREARGIWHQVWLCVPSNALLEPWLGEIRDNVGDATLVLLTPGINDLKILSAVYPADRIVSGMISMVSYFAPLPGQNLDPCTAFFFPPFSPSLFEGEAERVVAVTSMLQRGGCPAAVTNNARAKSALASAIMMPIIVALETEGWSLSKLRNSDTLLRGIVAARQALKLAMAEHGLTKTPLEKVLHPKLFQFGLAVAPSVTPFPLETYLRVHFTKVRVQTDQMMKRYLALGEEHNIGTDQIARLCAEWRRILASDASESFHAIAVAAPAPAPAALASGYDLPETDPGGPATSSSTLIIGAPGSLEEETDSDVLEDPTEH